MKNHYPINLDLEKKRCIVIGGGNVAERKVKRLLDCNAVVTLISPEVSSGIIRLRKTKKIKVEMRRVALKDLKGAQLVISASDDRKVNASVSDYCHRNNILINVVDSPKECNFILPSIVTRGDLSIAISTGGVSPALSKKIRQDLEKRFGIEYAKFLRLMKKARPRVIKGVKNAGSRKTIFEKIVKSNILVLIKKGREKDAKQKMERILKNDK